MDEDGTQNGRRIDTVCTSRIQGIDRLTDLSRVRIHPKSRQSFDQVGMVFHRYNVTDSLLDHGSSVDGFGVEEDRLAVDPAISATNFQADSLLIFIIKRTPCGHTINGMWKCRAD